MVINQNELKLALMAINATRRQVMADLDAIEARIRRAMSSITSDHPNISKNGAVNKEYWRKLVKSWGGNG